MAKEVKAPQLLGRSDKQGQFRLAPQPKYCLLPFLLYLLPVPSPSSTTERTVLDCTLYTTQRLLTPCSEERTFLFWLAPFYSQCVCLTLPADVSLLKYLCSHPAAPSGSCCDPGEGPASLIAQFRKEESQDSAQQLLLTGTQGAPDLPPQEATTSHRVLMLATLQMMGKNKICPWEILRLQNLAVTWNTKDTDEIKVKKGKKFWWGQIYFEEF